MENKARYKVLARYLKGDCTPEERADVEKWFVSLDTKNDDSRLFDSREEEELQKKMLAEIRQRIGVVTEKGGQKQRWMIMPMRVAASLLIIMLAGAAWFFLQSPGTHLPFAYNRNVSDQVITLNNNTQEVQEHRLPDGSVIQLHPRGTIVYAKPFAADKREVRLIGEAFFDVTKDKKRPFVINAHDVMVKVLGTSFNVTAYEDASEVKVAVKTGRVSVTRPMNYTRREGLDEVILTPNQEVIYSMVKENFSKQIVASPQIILPKPTLFQMEYDAAPVDEIFEVLEANYGIDIVYDPKVLSTCSLTTRMEEEGFYERIEIICKAIGATFEVQDAKVFIQSAGCRN
jgi:ferric-dicitrate binding protein FerR (iron transport regulator)